MSQALFAWEGFAFEHPDDWAPVSLTGNRSEGYARLQGSGRTGCQIRWHKSPKKPDLEGALDRYLEILARDAKKAKTAFQSERSSQTDSVTYRWSGAGQARGALLLPGDGRMVFLEITGAKSDSLLPRFRELLASFRIGGEDGLEPWALFGMRAMLPEGLSPASKALQSGKTWLTFKPPKATLELGRFAFGEELVRRHGLEPWARAALRLPFARIEVDGGRIRLEQERILLKPRAVGLVALDEERNQLVAVRAASNDPKWEPQWRWLD